MRRGPALFLAMTLGLAGVLVVASPASAHNQIVSSTPSPNETLSALPTQFSIDTNNVLLDLGGTGRGFAFEIQDAKGRYYQDGCVKIVDDNMSTTARLGAPGAYTIVFQLVSADGHTVSGEIPFVWAPAGPAVVTRGTADPPGCNGAKGLPKANENGQNTQAERTSTVPLEDVLWIGGVLVAVAIAVVVTLLLVSRGRRTEEEDSEEASSAAADPDETT